MPRGYNAAKPQPLVLEYENEARIVAREIKIDK
jgi:hypothetical protein